MTWKKSNVEWTGLRSKDFNLKFENGNLTICISTKYVQGDPRVFLFYDKLKSSVFDLDYIEISLLDYRILKGKEHISVNDYNQVIKFLSINKDRLIRLWNEPDPIAVFIDDRYVKFLRGLNEITN